MGKKIVSFYDYMMIYPHKIPGRLALAAEMRRLSRRHKEVKEIDCIVDMMAMVHLLKDQTAADAVSGNLWCEYCAASGHAMS